MRAVVIGASGLVGSALLRHLGPTSVGTFRSRQRPGLRHLDAADRAALDRLLTDVRPDVIFFPAGDPDVERCEREPESARELNLVPLERTLTAAGDTPVVAYSSDYVFDGTSGPYREQDPVAPLSVYGRLKVELEQAVLARGGIVVRPTGVFGVESAPAKNFVLRLVSTLGRGEPVRVPNDQIANPTFVEDLADASLAIAGAGDGGVWHVAGRDHLSREEFARSIARAFGLDQDLITGVPTADLGQKAARPLQGGLLCDRFVASFSRHPVRPLADALPALRGVANGQI